MEMNFIVDKDAARKIVESGERRVYSEKQIVRKPEYEKPQIDVRPAKIVGEWTRIDDGLWRTTASFLINNDFNENYVFSVFCFSYEIPSFSRSDTKPTVYVVWRGRWEILIAPYESDISYAKVKTAWTQNEARNAAITATLGDGGEIVSVLSPLSRYRDSLAANSRILIARVSGGSYILLNAECPE